MHLLEIETTIYDSRNQIVDSLSRQRKDESLQPLKLAAHDVFCKDYLYTVVLRLGEQGVPARHLICKLTIRQGFNQDDQIKEIVAKVEGSSGSRSVQASPPMQPLDEDEVNADFYRCKGIEGKKCVVMGELQPASNLFPRYDFPGFYQPCKECRKWKKTPGSRACSSSRYLVPHHLELLSHPLRCPSIPSKIRSKPSDTR